MREMNIDNSIDAVTVTVDKSTTKTNVTVISEIDRPDNVHANEIDTENTSIFDKREKETVTEAGTEIETMEDMTLIDTFYAREDEYYNLLKEKQQNVETGSKNNLDKKEEDSDLPLDLDLSEMVIEVCNVCSEDIDEMIDLHEELFPIKYSRAWYESVIAGASMYDADTPLYNWALVLKDSKSVSSEDMKATSTEESNEDEISMQNTLIGGESIHNNDEKIHRNENNENDLLNIEDTNVDGGRKETVVNTTINTNRQQEYKNDPKEEINNNNPSSSSHYDKVTNNSKNNTIAADEHNGKKQKLSQRSIIGMATAQFMPISSLEDNDLINILKKKYHLTHILYILTLGVRRQYRGRNLATLLLHKCIEHSKSFISSAGLFLHVIVNNQGAIGFYLKNGFHLLQEIPNFYEIQNHIYDSYVYVYLFEEKERKIWNQLNEIRKINKKERQTQQQYTLEKDSLHSNVHQDNLENLEKGIIGEKVNEKGHHIFSATKIEVDGSGASFLSGIFDSLWKPLSTMGSFLLRIVRPQNRNGSSSSKESGI